MRFKSVLMAASAAALSVLGACDQPAAPATAAAEAVEQRSAPTSALDPRTGEMVALNYRPVGKMVTIPAGISASLYEPTEPCDPNYELCGPCDPNYQICEPDPCDPTDPNSYCYTPPCSAAISTFNTYYAGIEPYGAVEVSGTTSSSCGFLVLTGIGARINGSDDYTTLALRGRRINPNGTWGETVNYRFGSSPNHTLEAWGEVPTGDNYGITGVAIGQSGTEDVRTLIVYYRKIELTSAGVRATGPTYTLRFGSSPYGYTDVSFLTYSDNEVFVGAAFRSIDQGERTATMRAFVGYLP